MSKDAINQYDATAANNTDVGGISIDEGMLPSNVNNALREIMSHLKDVDAGTSSLTSPVISGDLTISDKIIHSGDTNTAIRFAAADTVTVETAGSERMRILPAGGITFNGDTAAANALDDYEEGTFTFSESSANLSSFSTSDRTYTKIGRQVTLWMQGSFSVTAANTRTFFTVTLPFNAASNTTVIAGGGLAEGPNPFKGIALGVADASQSSATSAFCSFVPITTGSHNFWVTLTYNAS